MKHPSVYNLSKSCGPPHLDLRKAEIKDSYGDDSHASHPISHRVPEDVTREDLEFYPAVWGFLDFSDLLFYLYPVALEYETDRDLKCIDQYLYRVDRQIAEATTFSQEEQDALKEGLLWIWNAWPSWTVDWFGCDSLREFIEVTIPPEDPLY